MGQIIEMLQSPDKDINKLGTNLISTYAVSHHWVRDAYKLADASFRLKSSLLLKFKNYESVLI